MTELEKAARQALDALENEWFWPTPRFAIDAIDTLRAALAQQAEPVVWAGYDLDGMVEAFARVIEAHHQKADPFHNPINTDAMIALRVLRGIVPAMKAYTTAQQAEPVAVLAEREACAQILDRNAAVCGNNTMLRDVLTGNALAIRARGQQAEPTEGNPSF